MARSLPETASAIERQVVGVIDVERCVLFIIITLAGSPASCYVPSRTRVPGARNSATTVPPRSERTKCLLVLDLR